MKKSGIIILVAALVVAIAVGIGIGVSASQGGAVFRAGEGLRENLDSKDGSIAALFREHTIMMSAVEQQRSLNELRSKEDAANYESDRDIVDRLVVTLLLEEEAAARGIEVSEEDAEAMVDASLAGMEIEEGKRWMEEFLAGAGMTKEEYVELLRQITPGVILQQRVKDEIGREWCEANGYEFTKVNPPEGMLEAEQEYIEALLEQHRDEIVYYVD